MVQRRMSVHVYMWCMYTCECIHVYIHLCLCKDTTNVFTDSITSSPISPSFPFPPPVPPSFHPSPPQVKARVNYESVSDGDYGVYRQTNNGHPPAQFAWDGLGGDTYWLWWHQVEILPPLNDGADDDQGEEGREEGGGRESERNIFPRYSVCGLCIYMYIYVYVYVYMNLQVQEL